VQLDEEQGRGGKKRAFDEKNVRDKKKIFTKIHEALIAQRKDIKNVFAAADKDKNGTISQQELRDLFVTGMNIGLQPSEVDGMFLLMDIDMDGDISLPEFQTDFKRTVEKDVAILI
jgi:Ca2+-binding EF-hand superfamily protein